MQQELSDFCKKASFFKQLCRDNGIQGTPIMLPKSGLIFTELGYTLPPEAKNSHMREVMSDPVLQHKFQQTHTLLNECQSKMAFDAAYSSKVLSENK